MSAPAPRLDPWARAAGVAALGLVAIVLPILAVRGGVFSRDELGYFHIAYCLDRGMRLYRDFFDHHTPLFHFAMRVPILVFGPTFDAIVCGRAMQAALKALSLAGLVAILRPRHGTAAAIGAVALIASETTLLENGQRVYSDLPAGVALVCGAWAVLRTGGRRSLALAALSGGLLAAAPLLNLKALFPGAGIAALACLALWRRTPRAPHLAVFFGGGIAVAAATALAIGPSAWPAFQREVIERSLHWQDRHSVLPHVVDSLRANPIVWIAAGLGLGVWIREVLRRPFEPERHVVAAGAALAVVGAFAIPTVWDEYLVGTVPLLAGWIAPGLSALETEDARRPRPIALVLLAVVALQSVWLGRGSTASVAIAAAAVVLALPFALRTTAAGAGRTLGFVLALVLVPCALQAAVLAPRPNAQRIRRQAAFDRLAPPGSVVFDGFSGLGAFHPHPYYYWMAAPELVRQLPAHARGPDVVRALERRPPSVVVWNAGLEAFAPAVQDWVRARYEPAPNHPRWWIPREAAR